MEIHRLEGKQCSRPPALDELDLIAAADGEAGDDILAHLAACEHCADRAREITAVQGTLRRRLFRLFCPSSDELVAYYHHSLPGSRQAELARHLGKCPHCARELHLIERAADEPAQAVAPLRVLRRMVAELLSPPVPGGLAPLYGAARATGGAQYAYRAENLELTLRVARAAGRPGLMVMTGLLSTDDDALGETLNGATACLLADEAVLAVTPLDELGGFCFDEVAPGEYRLSLRLGECEVVVESLAL
jgi:hypothetical protein